MAITNYAELRTAVASWLMDRTDIPEYVGDFIRLGEGYINAELRVRQMMKTVPLTPVGGDAALPGDFLETIYVASSSPRRVLQLLSQRGADVYYGGRAGGVPAFYGIVGTTFSIYPGSGTPVELTYYAAIPRLSDANPTNWLLDQRPELYLRASLMQAAEFIKADGEAAKHKQLADMVIGQMMMQDMRSRGSGGIMMRGVTP